ncbi:MAG: HAMP domain-containing histidine kinase [Saprospiraceae bacterium]|jgi:signal transduction histidine kinase|nr:HAMP domain-containing histidine kinase [Saprospiraceae bacterium]
MKFLSYGVMVYMLMALVWWTILLSRNNKLIFEKNKELIQMQVLSPKDTLKLQLGEVQKDFESNRLMIWGEGLVFGLSLIAGMWFIQRAHTREVIQSQKEKNFLLSITHELKTPIASIRLLTETLMKRKLSEEKAGELKSGILYESDRLGNLVDNILIASRINAGYQYFFETIDLCPLIQTQVDHFRQQYPEASIQVDCPSSGVKCQTDKMAFQSMCSNLLENAIKYSGKKPQIDLRLEEHQSDVRMSITDAGIGIPEKERERIFDQFYRVGNEETRKTKGTGLGLFIVQKIVHAHKGTIKVYPNQPEGTVFTIMLPKIQSS